MTWMFWQTQNLNLNQISVINDPWTDMGCVSIIQNLFGGIWPTRNFNHSTAIDISTFCPSKHCISWSTLHHVKRNLSCRNIIIGSNACPDVERLYLLIPFPHSSLPIHFSFFFVHKVWGTCVHIIYMFRLHCIYEWQKMYIVCRARRVMQFQLLLNHNFLAQAHDSGRGVLRTSLCLCRISCYQSLPASSLVKGCFCPESCTIWYAKLCISTRVNPNAFPAIVG